MALGQAYDDTKLVASLTKLTGRASGDESIERIGNTAKGEAMTGGSGAINTTNQFGSSLFTRDLCVCNAINSIEYLGNSVGQFGPLS